MVYGSYKPYIPAVIVAVPFDKEEYCMHLHYLTLSRQAGFLHPLLSGSAVTGSYTQRKNEWVISLSRGGHEAGVLQLCCDGQFPYILHLDHNRRGDNSTGVMEELVGWEMAGVRILPGERIIEIRFRGREEQLWLQFFTARSNFFLIDGAGEILNAFKNARAHSGKRYPLAEPRLPDPFEMPPGDFAAVLRNASGDSVGRALKGFQFLSKPLIRELLFRCEIDPETPASALGGAQIALLADTCRVLRDEAETLPPRIYLRDGAPEKFAPLLLDHLTGYETEAFDDINAALRRFCFYKLKHRGVEQKQSQYRAVLERKAQSLQYALSQLQQRRHDPEKRAHYQRIGELIVSQPHLLQGRSAEIELTDYFDPEMPMIKVTVDPEKSVAENAEDYFHKARQYDENARQYEQRRLDLQDQLREVQRLLASLAENDSPKALEKIEQTLKAKHLLGYQAEEAETYRLPYKAYQFNGYDIWVGRNARDNDTLTFKHAAKEDFWLHVQGYAGSHVVIRNPQRREHLPPEVLNHAARLAVSFSAAKHASYVPVIYTKVKFVRKPRKSPPGAVLPSREKTIFADPL